MFGIVAGGRPVVTDLQQVDPTRLIYEITDAAKINHMAVFLLPGTVLPPGSAASVYAKLPGKDYTLLGALTESKQSAIFRFNTDAVSSSATDVDQMMDDDDVATSQFSITIGISLEPLSQVEQAIAAAKQAQAAKPKVLMPPSGVTPGTSSFAVPAPTNTDDIANLANKVVTHAYNYMSSFIDDQGKVPIKAFNDWWSKFKSKLAANPGFLNNVE